MAKQLLVFMIFSIVSVSLIAQNNHRNSCNTIKEKRIPRDNFKKSWSVGVFCGLPVVFGDVNVNPKSLGYGFHIQKNFGHSLAIRALYAQGTAKGADRKYADKNMVAHNPALSGINNSLVNYENNGKHTYMNYKMNFMESNLQLVYKFDFQDYRTTENPKTSFYIFLGAGAFLFDSWTDQVDKSGTLHDFDGIYQDYSAGNISQSESKLAVIEMLDGEYETPLDGNPQGTSKNFETVFFDKVMVPVVNGGIGIRFKLNPRFDLSIESKATYTGNDLLDGQRWTRSGTEGLSEFNDIYLFTSIGLNIRLGKTDKIYWFDNPSAQHYKVTLENKRKITELSSDSDYDGVSDYFDEDPFTPQGVKVDVKGVPLDSDNDGIADFLDDEPFSDKKAIVDTKGVSIDTDGDGVPNHKDLDNNTPEGKFVNLFGKSIETFNNTSSTNRSNLRYLPALYFKFEDASLGQESLYTLVAIAASMKYNPNTKLKVIGYSDQIGSLEYNERLSKKRAENVINFLVIQGISKDRFIIESKGETELLNEFENIDNDRFNRRVQLQVIDEAVQPVHAPFHQGVDKSNALVNF